MSLKDSKKTEEQSTPICYRGETYRSKLQVKWAVFMDILGVKYQHEPYDFLLDERVRYCPDFFLPSQDVYLVVKGGAATESDFYKAQLWLRENGDVVILEGFPAKQGHLVLGRERKPPLLTHNWVWGECPRCFTVALRDFGIPHCNCYSADEMEEMLDGELTEIDFTRTDNIVRAYSEAAKWAFVSDSRAVRQPSLFDMLSAE